MAKLSVERALRKAISHERNGQIDEARKCYVSILELFPGNIKAKQGLTKLSESKLGTLAGKSPSEETLGQLVALYNKGEFKTVTLECERLTKEFPQSFVLWNLLGAAHNVQGTLEEAIAAYRKALLIKPDYADAYNNMGNALTGQGKLEEAIVAFNKALSINPGGAGVHYNMGAVFQMQNKFEEAIAAYKKALLIEPDYAEAHNNMGIALTDQGKLEDAIAAFNKALSTKPDYTEAHLNLSALKKYTHSDSQMIQMGELYADTNISVESRCLLCFALAKSFEDLGNLEEAFRYLKEGNALRKKILAYDIAQDEEKYSKIKETANSFKDFSFDGSGGENIPTPILILGMPRSGTTLIEQIISSHSKVTAADELDFLNRFGSRLAEGEVEVNEDKLRKVRNQYLNGIKQLSVGRPFVTDKMPSNFFYIGLICSALPEAKIIHVKRNPAATCWSNYKKHFETKTLGYSYNLTDLVHYYRMYQELMLFWDERYPGKIYHLDYEQLTIDQQSETKKLIQYLGIDWEDTCLFPEKNKRYVKTASSVQVREKVYKGSSEEWKNFEKYLDGAFGGLPN